MSNILVVAEQSGGQLKKSTLSAITLARQLAQRSGGAIDIVVAGHQVGGVADALQGYGARTIHVVDAQALEHYLAQPYKAAVVAAANAAGASFVVAPAGTFGKDLMPRVAAALGAGMVSDCTGLADGAELLYKRPMFAGNIIATVRVTTPKTVVTVRTSEIDAADKAGGASAVAALAADVGGAKARFVKYETTESDRPELTEADVVVSGGRGTKSPQKFWELLNPLANTLNAAIGATRAVVDEWAEVPNDMQVGQTGKVVAPKLYIAVGVSGAIQHLAGMKNSKTIVAINTDADAPIFAVADYGLVGDAAKVVPELTQKLAALRG
ncbi:MAG: electron transfer flavoprotein subunit alpha/FixB family protein [Deltaproteobacteria bacterium]|nr:electron transfer flavoprotein subunit alpha/FixB family protein [Deltaproteobacteria bacterium]